jgi:hypothetical protein
MSFAYKRINHFKELLSNTQGENINVDINLVQRVKEELGEQELSIRNIKLILKKNNQKSHYENIVTIFKNLGGKVIEFSPKEELKLCELFEIISTNYSKEFPLSSFPSYHYIIYRLVEYIQHPKLNFLSIGLKDPEKIDQLDHIWNVMVKYLTN